ncbi:hypothetical protein BRADI_3g32475v3 [Brachypodium distachyon]|uniref:Uncharacterized protein n=1 Tax=Brachypodium distachyon TaxID=15368 RepID=A0A0Q3HVZ5_BRADI|nr:hypothetical protein BRADI_3g32475v3 [Brachypodium distachyon]
MGASEEKMKNTEEQKRRTRRGGRSTGARLQGSRSGTRGHGRDGKGKGKKEKGKDSGPTTHQAPFGHGEADWPKPTGLHPKMVRRALNTSRRLDAASGGFRFGLLGSPVDDENCSAAPAFSPGSSPRYLADARARHRTEDDDDDGGAGVLAADLGVVRQRSRRRRAGGPGPGARSMGDLDEPPAMTRRAAATMGKRWRARAALKREC